MRSLKNPFDFAWLRVSKAETSKKKKKKAQLTITFQLVNILWDVKLQLPAYVSSSYTKW